MIVVGAGPAGCAAAASARRTCPSASILVLDRADFPRDKVCGDGIAAEVTTALADLGFCTDVIFAGAPAVQRLVLRSPRGVTCGRTMRREVHVLPRAIFDDRLVCDIRSRGIDVRRHTVRAVAVTTTQIVVDDTFRARVLIGADGAESVVRRSVGVPAPRSAQVAIAIRGYAPELAGQGGAQLIAMSDRDWPAYAWSFPLGDGRANVGYGQLPGRGQPTRAGMLDRMAALLPGLDPQPAHLRGHRLPLSTGRPAITAGPVLLVGDAQSLINPLTGEGIYYAVTSGELAGRAAGAALGEGQDAGLVYRRLLRGRLGRHLRHTSGLAWLTRRPYLVEAGIRAAAADQRVFDDLVRIGLADGLVTGAMIGRLRPTR